MRARLVVVLALVCGACGDGGADGEDGQDGTVLTSMDLPVGSKQCPTGGLLLTIDGSPKALCNGEDGDNGKDGATGAMGAPGEDGQASGYQPVLIMSCSVALDFYSGNDGINETLLAHDAVIYSNGDAEVSCVATAADQNGSERRYFASGTLGASKLGCTAAIDYPPSTDGVNGFMDFSLGAEGPTATYHDAPNPMHLDYFAFEDAQCTVRKWTGAAWALGTLADLP